MSYYQEVSRPTLFLDKDRCLRNLDKMIMKARASDVAFRPHFKTHQSLEIGRWFREKGVAKITVSSLGMAVYFASDGWDDITVAFPVNIREINTINSLAGRISVNILVEDPDVVHRVDNALHHTVGAFVKIDVGSRRTGIHYADYRGFADCLKSIEKSEHLRFKGVISHAGHTYDARGSAQVEKIYRETVDHLVRLKMQFQSTCEEFMISYGDTPSCSIVRDISDLDEIRPGNFIFYDLMQEQIGVCTRDDIAIALAAPVVALHPDRGQFVIYAGAIHLSTENLATQDGKRCFGMLAKSGVQGWETQIARCVITGLSQEHGMVDADQSIIENVRVGDVLFFLPVHACLTAQCMGGYTLTTGARIDHYAGKKNP